MTFHDRQIVLDRDPTPPTTEAVTTTLPPTTEPEGPPPRQVARTDAAEIENERRSRERGERSLEAKKADEEIAQKRFKAEKATEIIKAQEEAKVQAESRKLETEKLHAESERLNEELDLLGIRQRIADAQGFTRCERDWRALLEAGGVDTPFLSFEWLHAWWRVFGRRGALELLAARRNGATVALLPLFRRPPRPLRLEPFPVRALLGTGAVGSDYLDLIGDDGAALDAFCAYLGERPAPLTTPQARSPRRCPSSPTRAPWYSRRVMTPRSTTALLALFLLAACGPTAVTAPTPIAPAPPTRSPAAQAPATASSPPSTSSCSAGMSGACSCI